MISASGLRALVDGKVDFTNSRNMIIVSVVLSIGLGLGAMSLAGDITGNNNLKIMIGKIEISPLALSTLAGILLNLIFPEKRKGEKSENKEDSLEDKKKGVIIEETKASLDTDSEVLDNSDGSEKSVIE